MLIGNPPYIRQELLSPYKSYLEKTLKSYHGAADIFIYFYEQGIRILKPEGLLSFIVSNKWLKAGYGKALRRFFSDHTVFEQIIDFGHAPIFEDADTFPCIVTIQKPETSPAQNHQPRDVESVTICSIPREKLPRINLKQYVRQYGHKAPWSRYTERPWSLEHPDVDALMEKIGQCGSALEDYIGTPPMYGVKTGLMKAFVIDAKTRAEIIQSDSKAIDIIKPCLRGQDIKRWHPGQKDLWMILAHHGLDINEYPSVKKHLDLYKEKLKARAGKQLWSQWQTSPTYIDLFQKPKIIYQDLCFHPRFCFSSTEVYMETTCFFLSSLDYWLLSVLNSPLMWSFLWRNTIHGKDEVLRLKTIYMKKLPIAPATHSVRSKAEEAVEQLIDMVKENQETTLEVLDWLYIERGIKKPGRKLMEFASLESDSFIKEIKKRSPKGEKNISPKTLKEIRQVYNDYTPPFQGRQAEISRLEHRLSDLVNQAYGLTENEIDLLWNSAPPRMPIRRTL